MNENNALPQQILQELMRIGFARATDHVAVSGGALVIRPSEELTDDQAAAIASLERTSAGIKVKFYDKLKALELLGKMFGLYEGKTTQPSPDNHLLQAIMDGTREELNVYDIPELEQTSAHSDDLVESAPAS